MYTVWSMGSLGALNWSQVALLGLVLGIGLVPVVFSIKSYNALLLGESYARSMGIRTERLRWIMIGSTGILAGGITAFCGPIAFLGIAVPHLARMLWKTSDHRILFPGSAVLGAILLLLCDALGHRTARRCGSPSQSGKRGAPVAAITALGPPRDIRVGTESEQFCGPPQKVAKCRWCVPCRCGGSSRHRHPR
jgi:ABC-type Fe3+-siderophore transport system permease subunit